MGSRGIAQRLPADTQLVVPHGLRPFHLETLALLGLDHHPRVTFSPSDYCEVENLYLVTPRLKTQIDTAEPFRWFRRAVMERYGLDEAEPTRRLYVSRRHDNHWRLTNEDEVEGLLARHGFETVMPARLSFREQAELFAGASAIVGTGAGLFNMVFSPPGTQVLEIQEPSHMVHALWTQAAAMGFEYHYVLGDSVPNDEAADADIHLPVAKLTTALAAMECG